MFSSKFIKNKKDGDRKWDERVNVLGQSKINLLGKVAKGGSRNECMMYEVLKGEALWIDS